MLSSLIDILAFLSDTDPKFLHCDWDHDATVDLLEGERITTLHLKKNRSFKFAGLTRRCASHQAYHVSLGISVEQHYYSRYGRELDYAHLPCVIEFGDFGQINFYPLEVVTSKHLATALN
ncbi:hypothetical protein AAVH_30137 [Aphelenchoides avenae]|nr:hypothetical protein AAVH_30137 [Aphelenchus avenae]